MLVRSQDEDLKYEIQQEIDEVLHDSITDLLNETGISINYVTVQKGTTRTKPFSTHRNTFMRLQIYLVKDYLEPMELQPYDTEEEWEEDVAQIESS